MVLGGRPKEQGGHKPLKISVDKFVAQGLEKVGNKSQFLESVARPVLEKMDPGEASIFLWQIDIYLSQGIIAATKEGNFGQVQALGWLASQLEDARKLCGIPQSKEELQLKRKMIFESEKDKARAFQIIRATEALVRPLTQEEMNYFLQDDGKSKLDKAQALQTKLTSEALL